MFTIDNKTYTTREALQHINGLFDQGGISLVGEVFLEMIEAKDRGVLFLMKALFQRDNCVEGHFENLSTANSISCVCGEEPMHISFDEQEYSA